MGTLQGLLSLVEKRRLLHGVFRWPAAGTQAGFEAQADGSLLLPGGGAKGRRRRVHSRERASTSLSVCGSLTNVSQSVGRAAGPGASMAPRRGSAGTRPPPILRAASTRLAAGCPST